MSMLVFGLIGALAVAWTTLIGSDHWVNAHRIMDGPGNESCLCATVKRGNGDVSGHLAPRELLVSELVVADNRLFVRSMKYAPVRSTC